MWGVEAVTCWYMYTLALEQSFDTILMQLTKTMQLLTHFGITFEMGKNVFR